MVRRLLVLTVVAGFVLGGTACGSDGDTAEDTTTTAEETTSTTEEESTTTTAKDEDGGEPSDEDTDAGDGEIAPEVEAFCAEVDEYSVLLEQVLADPSSVDLSQVGQLSQELTAASEGLASADLDADDAARIQECSATLSAAVSGG
jgi:hypothetical protein